MLCSVGRVDRKILFRIRTPAGRGPDVGARGSPGRGAAGTAEGEKDSTPTGRHRVQVAGSCAVDLQIDSCKITQGRGRGDLGPGVGCTNETSGIETYSH